MTHDLPMPPLGLTEVEAAARFDLLQRRLAPIGKVELPSTHDQVLGGPSGQSYLGCRFPADVRSLPPV